MSSLGMADQEGDRLPIVEDGLRNLQERVTHIENGGLQSLFGLLNARRLQQMAPRVPLAFRGPGGMPNNLRPQGNSITIHQERQLHTGIGGDPHSAIMNLTARRSMAPYPQQRFAAPQNSSDGSGRPPASGADGNGRPPGCVIAGSSPAPYQQQRFSAPQNCAGAGGRSPGGVSAGSSTALHPLQRFSAPQNSSDGSGRPPASGADGNGRPPGCVIAGSSPAPYQQQRFSAPQNCAGAGGRSPGGVSAGSPMALHPLQRFLAPMIGQGLGMRQNTADVTTRSANDLPMNLFRPVAVPDPRMGTMNPPGMNPPGMNPPGYPIQQPRPLIPISVVAPTMPRPPLPLSVPSAFAPVVAMTGISSQHQQNVPMPRMQSPLNQRDNFILNRIRLLNSVALVNNVEINPIPVGRLHMVEPMRERRRIRLPAVRNHPMILRSMGNAPELYLPITRRRPRPQQRIRRRPIIRRRRLQRICRPPLRYPHPIVPRQVMIFRNGGGRQRRRGSCHRMLLRRQSGLALVPYDPNRTAPF